MVAKRGLRCTECRPARRARGLAKAIGSLWRIVIVRICGVSTRRRHQSHRGGRPHGDDWQPLRWQRRGPRRDHSVPRPQLQGVPGHGSWAPCAPAARTAISSPTSASTPSWCRRHRGTRALRGVSRNRVPAHRCLRSGIGYCGCRNIAELHSKARFIKITQMVCANRTSTT